jgi:hypothetical protein
MADGRYRLKLVAKDTPENPIGQALSTEKVSEPFVVDNTGPALKEFQVQRQNQGFTFFLRCKIIGPHRSGALRFDAEPGRFAAVGRFE